LQKQPNILTSILSYSLEQLELVLLLDRTSSKISFSFRFLHLFKFSYYLSFHFLFLSKLAVLFIPITVLLFFLYHALLQSYLLYLSISTPLHPLFPNIYSYNKKNK